MTDKIKTVEIIPPHISQIFHRELLLTGIKLLYEDVEELKIKSCIKYPLGTRKRQKCMKIIETIEKLYEWSTTKEKEKKNEIILVLLDEIPEISGNLRIIIQKLHGFIQQ